MLYLISIEYYKHCISYVYIKYIYQLYTVTSYQYHVHLCCNPPKKTPPFTPQISEVQQANQKSPTWNHGFWRATVAVLAARWSLDDLTEIKGYAIGCLHAMISDIARCQVPNHSTSRLCLFLRSQNVGFKLSWKKNPGWLAGLFSDINWEGSSI